MKAIYTLIAAVVLSANAYATTDIVSDTNASFLNPSITRNADVGVYVSPLETVTVPVKNTSITKLTGVYILEPTGKVLFN